MEQLNSDVLPIKISTKPKHVIPSPKKATVLMDLDAILCIKDKIQTQNKAFKMNSPQNTEK